MLPLIQAEEIKHSVVEYLKATFNFEDKAIDAAFEDLLLNKRQGMFKGPYMQMRLPFDKVESEEDVKAFNESLFVRPSFNPYYHQFESFKKLSTRNGHEPEPVILTTGTGSGKTESFLFPLLDYCYQHRETPGIKAIILYPMNALATDQARRIAEEINAFTDENGEQVLNGKIRAGLFIGEGAGKKGQHRPNRMGEDHIIEDRATLLKSPPDILLTNFKMLDFSLLQAQFHGLWKHNFKHTELLKFLVLDELHTYDGAKGSDVANLIRRLKLKLNLNKDQIVPVGTSATMAGGEDGKEELVQFFSQVFGVTVGTEAVIGEQRIEPEEFFEDDLVIPLFDLKKIDDCKFKEEDTYNLYIKRQLELWNYTGLEPEDLGRELKKNQWLYKLLSITKSEVQEIKPILNRWIDSTGIELPNEDALKLFGSLLALVTYAKEKSGKRLFPFLYVQITYWMRSLNRLVRKLQPAPEFAWESDLNPNDETKVLPPYFCRDCGGSGWVGVKKEHAFKFEDDLTRTRTQFFGKSNNKNAYLVSSLDNQYYADVFASDYSYTGDPIDGFLHPHSYDINDRKESDELFKIFGVRNVNGNRIDKICPHCNSRNTLALIGTGVPTLESIAAAQILATATDNTDDHKRKLLAFTNSVQDAAHQAGFIENRNFRFGMRHAIQSVINVQSKPTSLKSMYSLYEDKWKDPTDQLKLDAYFYKFLPPDCSARMELEDYRNKDKTFRKSFEDEFSNRMSWEIWAEYSYRAIIGRTLEKSSASATSFDEERMSDVFNQLNHWLQQNELKERVEKEDFLKFLNGFLHRLRTKGGVDHPYLRKYRTERTNYYLITQNVNKKYFLMQNFGKNTRLPKFITLSPGKNTKAFDIVQMDTKHNWFSTYFLKSFPQVRKTETQLINEFYENLLEYLDANDILDKKVASGVINFGLDQDQVFIEKDVASFECSECGHQMHSGKSGAHLTENMKCLQYRCSGDYKSFQSVDLDYYRMVYNRGKALRIFASDHTGLIDRNKREEIERDFKQQPTFKSLNVLVATSTLEMGIDIGDLNVTFNSSLPPETANYLQRVGRAGRSSGTSLILNVAGRGEHDLYYYQDPMAMMGGEIKTPACYLEAKDILRRHFMAFCFDSWASKDHEQNKIPPMVRMLSLKSIKVGSSEFVFNEIAEFIDNHKTKLYESFVDQYTGSIKHDSQSLVSIKNDLSSGSFSSPLRNIQSDLLNELAFYDKKRKSIIKQIKKLPATGEETAILNNERKALSGAIYNINHRNVIEHLTNIGVLPNYAFPETGVRLNAQIRRKKEIDGKTEYKYEQFGDIVRASSSALTELAPGNKFYSQGYMLHSDGLEIRSKDDYETYRFCGNCDLLKLEIDVPSGQHECPVCGDGSWSSISNRKTLVKLQSVMSVNDQEKARITDSSDERDRLNYQKSVHIEVDHKSSEGAHVLKRVPFGIEFFHSVKYTEINTGIREEDFFGTQEIEINGTDHPEVGFVVCETCGKSTEKPITQYDLDKKKRSYHFPYCSNKGEHYDDKESGPFREIYLYRRFNTEALLILLPVQEFRSQERIALFKSGLQLGLKGYFKGEPDHILIRESEAYNQESRRKEKYLVLFETIPGGTGYLSKLFDTEEFTNVLKSAYESIAFCSCKSEGKDGCYRCIYTYGNQHERTILSRNEAESLFTELLEKADEWNRIESLQNVQGFANNEESDLELMFIDSLKNLALRNKASSFEQISAKGVKKYVLDLATEKGSIKYEVWPQNLGVNLQGLRLQTRPDFLLKPIAVRQNKRDWSIEEVEAIKPIVIYLDGYQYHASAEHPRFASDVAIRNEIVQSEQYYQWTLVWNDFKESIKDLDFIGDSINKKSTEDRLLKKHPLFIGTTFEELGHFNNLSRLFRLLFSPSTELEPELWSSLILFNSQNTWLEKCFTKESVERSLSVNSLDHLVSTKSNPKEYAQLTSLNFKNEASISGFILPETFEVKVLSTFKKVEGWEKDNWELFWQYYNLFQFHRINSLLIEPSVILDKDSEDDSIEVLDNFDPSLHHIVMELVKNEIEFNEEFDFDLLEDEVIVAQAELGSASKKFFLNPFDEESRQKFVKEGFTEFTPEGFKIKNHL